MRVLSLKEQVQLQIGIFWRQLSGSLRITSKNQSVGNSKTILHLEN